MVESRLENRILAWEGCRNVRDLGGYPTTDGGQTRWGAIARSDTLSALTDSGRRAVVEHGIRTIVDLRLPRETVEYPNPFAGGAHGIEYVNISFVDPARDLDSTQFERLSDNYLTMIERYRDRIGQVMSTVAGASEGGVLIHCMGGKDRTGIISALLLDLVGVPREVIGQDYGLTAELLRADDEEWLENGPGTREEREVLLRKFTARPEVMQEVLAGIDEQYGGVEPFLESVGMTEAERQRLRERLVD